MKRQKKSMNGKQIAVMSILLLITVLAVCGCGTDQSLTLEKIAYNKSKKNPIVYLKENGDYVPYLVLTSNYGGNVLLLREHVLPEIMQYKRHGPGWAGYEYGSYYEQSSIDKFLNTEFLEMFSEDMRASIVDTTIEVTDKESYDEWNYATHMIQRKVFLLSSIELGVKGLDGLTTAKEGSPLKYFKNKEFSVKTAYRADGTGCPYWTRTPELWETYTVIMIGTDAVDNCTADIYSGVRPAFCMGKDTIIQESENIIPGETVYIVEFE